MERVFPSKLFPCQKRGSCFASGSSARRQMIRTWSKELALAQSLLTVSKRWRFIANYSRTFLRTEFLRSHSSHMVWSKSRILRPMRLCDWGSDEHSTSSGTRWSRKRRAFAAMMCRSAQEYEASSTTNADGAHCEKMEGGCQNNTTFPEECSRVGSKLRGPSRRRVCLRRALQLFGGTRGPTRDAAPGLRSPAVTRYRT